MQIEGLHWQAPALHVECVLHWVTAPTGQLSPSRAQWTDVLLAPQESLGVLAAVQPLGSVLHLQSAAPADGVAHDWCGPQATAVSA